MQCPSYQSEADVKRGFDTLQDGNPIQHYQCKACHKRFNERTSTPMAHLCHLCHSSVVISYAINAHPEG